MPAKRSQGEPEPHYWHYSDLERMTGKEPNTLYKGKERRLFDPESLESIVYFVARHGTPDVKRNILEYALETHAKNPALKGRKK